jgi:hypothetical protein
MIMQTPWAILLLKFSDNDSEPYPRQRYEEIFTTAGSGKWNIVDYFRDMSHAKLDLSGSKVFGWFTLDKALNEYSGSGANQAGRQELIDWARAKATAEGVKLDDFFSVVVVLNVGADLFGGGSGVVCGDDGANLALSGLSPSYLGQEMGHTYGLNHSRKEGSASDYQDRYDVMSTASALMSPHPVYRDLDRRGEPVFRIGPGINAANMWSMGWLDETRVWNEPSFSRFSATIQLRPLHRTDLSGFLAARFQGYFLEFRMNSGWDAALPPCVLIHRFEDGRSYLVSDSSGDDRFDPGDGIATPDEMSVLGSGISIKVISIDAANQVATISLSRTPAQIPQVFPKEGPFQTPWIKWSEIIPQGQALVVLDGKPVTIPRQSPLYKIVENIALYGSGGQLMSGRLQSAVRHEAISQIATLSQQELSNLQFRGPAQPLLHVTEDSLGGGGD